MKRIIKNLIGIVSIHLLGVEKSGEVVVHFLGVKNLVWYLILKET